MSSALAALSPEERAEVIEAIGYRHLERALVAYGVEQILLQRLEREVRVANPAVGAELTVTVPAGLTWDLLSIFTVFLTSAAVANRRPILAIKDQDGNVAWRIDSATTQAAGQTGRTAWLKAAIEANTGNTILNVLPLESFSLPAGWTISTVTASLDVGDSYTSTIIMVREWAAPRVVQVVEAILADLDSAGGI